MNVETGIDLVHKSKASSNVSCESITIALYNDCNKLMKLFLKKANNLKISSE